MARVRHRPSLAAPDILNLIDGKWTGVIPYHLLLGGALPFNELRRRLPGVTQRRLTHRLRDLGIAGLLIRKVFPEVPQRVE